MNSLFKICFSHVAKTNVSQYCTMQCSVLYLHETYALCQYRVALGMNIPKRTHITHPHTTVSRFFKGSLICRHINSSHAHTDKLTLTQTVILSPPSWSKHNQRIPSIQWGPLLHISCWESDYQHSELQRPPPPQPQIFITNRAFTFSSQQASTPNKHTQKMLRADAQNS